MGRLVSTKSNGWVERTERNKMGTTIFKIHKLKDNYVKVPNDAARDKRLSFKATGLLTYLLSLPEDWQINSEHLADQKTDGRAAILSAFKELRECGYAKLEPIKGENGLMEGKAWHIFAEPECHETREAENRNIGKPACTKEREVQKKESTKERVLPGVEEEDANADSAKTVIAEWNAKALPHWRKSQGSAPILKKAQRCLKDRFWREHWRKALDAASRSPILSRCRDWNPDITWFLRVDQKNTVAKLIEGGFDFDIKDGKPGAGKFNPPKVNMPHESV